MGYSKKGRRRYLRTTLTRNRKEFARSIHRLVLEAFYGTCPDGFEACHNNGDKLDNRLSNLRWDTHKSNIQDSYRHGKIPIGETHHNTKFTTSQVEEIRRRVAIGEIQVALAKEFSVSPNAICRVVNRKTWKHIP
jgi:hypothetical protein